MYKNIIDPRTHLSVEISSNAGKKLLKSYLDTFMTFRSQSGGTQISDLEEIKKRLSQYSSKELLVERDILLKDIMKLEQQKKRLVGKIQVLKSHYSRLKKQTTSNTQKLSHSPSTVMPKHESNSEKSENQKSVPSSNPSVAQFVNTWRNFFVINDSKLQDFGYKRIFREVVSKLSQHNWSIEGLQNEYREKYSDSALLSEFIEGLQEFVRIKRQDMRRFVENKTLTSLYLFDVIPNTLDTTQDPDSQLVRAWNTFHKTIDENDNHLQWSQENIEKVVQLWNSKPTQIPDLCRKIQKKYGIHDNQKTGKKQKIASAFIQFKAEVFGKKS